MGVWITFSADAVNAFPGDVARPAALASAIVEIGPRAFCNRTWSDGIPNGGIGCADELSESTSPNDGDSDGENGTSRHTQSCKLGQNGSA